MSATDTPRDDEVMPTQIIWNLRFRRSGGATTGSAVALIVIVAPSNIHHDTSVHEGTIIHGYVNDDMTMNAWQDESVDDDPEVRYIQDVETLRALAEPTRLAILEVLLKPPWPRVMAAKELAAE